MAQTGPSLKQRIRKIAAAQGGMSVAEYMTLALYDRRQGYYTCRAALGGEGDFITAPEISPLFQALVAQWMRVQARRLESGASPPAQLVELGPGRGLIARALARACEQEGVLRPIALVECDPAMRAVQQAALASYRGPVRWFDDLGQLPAAPSVVFANEFLDCLPIRQWVRDKGQWRERMVIADPDRRDGLAFALGAPAPDPFASGGLVALDGGALAGGALPDGALIESRPGAEQLAQALADLAARAPIATLFIDYGPGQSEVGDTLQAVRGHQKLGPLDAPGESDLTARVDFAAFKSMLEARGLTVQGPVTQAELLARWGLAGLLEQVQAASPPDQAERHRRAAERLTGADQMGELFKALAIGAPHAPGAATDLFAAGH